MYRLAFHLGYANPDRMLREMSAEHVQEWMVFAELEPFGEDRQDKRTGMITQILMNVYRDSRKRSTPYVLSECVPVGGDAFAYEKKRHVIQTWQEMQMIAVMLTAASSRES